MLPAIWITYAVASTNPPVTPLWVLGGEPAIQGDAPWVAAVEFSGQTLCTGVLIAPDRVLTAGHCAYGVDAVRLDSADLAVEAGERLLVAEVIPYPNHWVGLDVAVIRLATAASAKPLPLARDCESFDYLFDGAPATVWGYGALDPEGVRYGTALQRAELTIDIAACTQVERGCTPLVFPSGELIASAPDADSCTGDSGGPLTVWTASGWRLAGLTSRAALPATVTCGDGGIYVRADAIAAWLDSLDLGVARPDCEGWNEAPTLVPALLPVTRGERATFALQANDADNDEVRFSLLAVDDAEVVASLDETGALVLEAGPGAAATSWLALRLDDGRGGVTEARAPVLVLPPRAAGGCAHTRAPLGGWLAGLTLLAARRRRR